MTFCNISVISFSASGIRTQSLRAIDPKFFFSSSFFLLSALRIYVALTIFQSYISAPAGFEPRAFGPLILNYLFFFLLFFVKCFKDLRCFNDISVISFSASGIRTQSLRAIDPKSFIFFFFFFFFVKCFKDLRRLNDISVISFSASGIRPRAFGPLILNYLFFFFFFLLSALRIYVALTIFQSYLSAPAGFEPRAFGPLIPNYLFFFFFFFLLSALRIYVALTIFQSYLSAPAGFEPRAFGSLILNYLFFFSFIFLLSALRMYVALTIFQSYHYLAWEKEISNVWIPVFEPQLERSVHIWVCVNFAFNTDIFRGHVVGWLIGWWRRFSDISAISLKAPRPGFEPRT